MESHLNKKEYKWTNVILIILTLVIILYVGYIKGLIPFGTNKLVQLEEVREVIALDIKKKSDIGLNGKQIYEVTSDGITTYNFEGDEIWSDTFSMKNVVTIQRKPYIAVGSKKGKSVILFNEKGRQVEVTTTHPIVYFSINESGGIVTIENNNNTYIVTAYDVLGKRLCARTTSASIEGYPTVAELSPDNKQLIISYLSVDEPQVVSRVVVIDVEDSKTQDQDNVKYGYRQNNNLIYEIEFISSDTWVTIGDKAINWYDVAGEQLSTQSNISPAFIPYLTKMSQHGMGYLPVILTEKPTQNIVHRQDQLVYFDYKGEKIFSLELEGGISSFCADENGITLALDNVYRGYNKLGNLFFEYTATTDVSKVVYDPNLRKGIAVSKEKVFLLTPKKEKN